ncbi:MAG TPA: hypothetical protein VFK86_03960 [Bauldia sp.]|nr:hypothetical protein [Bauldia sp.]
MGRNEDQLASPNRGAEHCVLAAVDDVDVQVALNALEYLRRRQPVANL